MKKIVLMAVILLSSVSMFAQRRVGSVSIQPKIGLNISDVTSSDGNSRVGLVTGAEFEFQVTDIFSLSAGALYSQQGEKNGKIDYLNFPLLGNVYVAPGLAVKLGLQPGVNVDNGNIQGVNSFDLSIPVGLSYEINHVVLEGRYNIGATKIVDYTDWKNSVFQFTIGYKFMLK